ncbi:4-coumarate--CoA ligase [Coemansia sp. RSA 1972]|nr:4-coumarate--CoA ligase [Coemansia sp. RSA 1972]
MPVGDIPSFMFHAAERYKDEVVLVDAATEQTFTISDICSTSTQLAAGLVHNGYGGKVISVFDNTELRCVYVYYAALMAGGAYQSLSTDTAPDKLRACIAYSQTPVVFTTAAYLPRLQEAIEGLDVAVYVFGQTHGSCAFAKLLKDDASFLPVRLTSRAAMAKPAYLAYTSNVQESLQPLVFSHFGLLSSYCMGRTPCADSPGKTAVSAVPFANSHAIVNIAHFPILSGSRVVQMSQCDAESCLEALEKWRPGVFLATYSVLASIVAQARRDADSGVVWLGARAFDISQLQVIFMHELRGSRVFKDKVAALFGARLVELYGYMEVGLIAGIITEYPRVEGSVGLLCPNVCARVVLDGKELGDCQYGEILVSTPRLAATAAASDETPGDLSSYFHTGDYGTVTSDGVVIVKARMTELLHVRGGLVVAPSDIEEQLLRQPQVADCAVVAVRKCVDDIAFDVPVVFIVPSGSVPNIDDLLEPLVLQYPGIHGQLIDSIPRTDKGSPERAALQKLVYPF